jgi:hypothetical protein
MPRNGRDCFGGLLWWLVGDDFDREELLAMLLVAMDVLGIAVKVLVLATVSTTSVTVSFRTNVVLLPTDDTDDVLLPTDDANVVDCCGVTGMLVASLVKERDTVRVGGGDAKCCS